jgi:hypothetical protein
MLAFIKQQIAGWKWRRSVLGQVLADHTRKYFYGQEQRYALLSRLGEKDKDKLILDFYGTVSAIAQSPNPFIELRKATANYTLQFAALQVLCLKEGERQEAFYRDNPYISGQLYSHIRQASDHNDTLAQYKRETPAVSDEDLVVFAQIRCALLLYYANGLGLVRMEGSDKPEKDWFRPTCRSMPCQRGTPHARSAGSANSTQWSARQSRVCHVPELRHQRRARSRLRMGAGLSS